MYQSLKQEYLKHIEESKRELGGVKKRLYSLGTLRLIIFVLTLVQAFYLPAPLFYCLIALGLVVFLALLLIDNKLQKKKVYLETSIRCYEDELKALDYDFSAFDGAPEMIDSSHSFTLDLDVFGSNSLFQSMNRTSTDYGKRVLLAWFTNPLRSKSIIEQRQEAVAELQGKKGFMHRFRVLGTINQGRSTDYQEVKDFVSSADLISSVRFWTVIKWLFPVLWVAGIVLTSLSVLPVSYLIAWYIFTLIVSESQAKKVSRLNQIAGDKVKTLETYSKLMEAVEEESFNSRELKHLRAAFLQGGTKASLLFKRFARLTGELDQRENLLVHLLFNPFLLWDIRVSMSLERWKKNGAAAVNWIESLGEIDAYCSLGNYAGNHPDYVFPSISEEYFVFEGKALGHPLMRREQCVRNDININQHPYFLIITGANMAGKSTYLRTLGVNYLLSCLGLPAFAEELKLYPASLVTSLRTSDSLSDNESYFFAELKRLKMIIDRLESGEQLFILLDEILKGTNSVDKQKGSLALVRQFVRLGSCGVISTHDLLLGKLEEDFPAQVKNYRFEADIEDAKLSFSYLLREGIAQNMNASFLMKRMGITL